ncbi:MAG TPA: recombination mediator RecR [Kofleriaceae bacterium]|nr:recombination mediator RecR [Kofleriaceae bacterium]HMG53322.1 recombination mediator RecR [Kofleriaceae bacterium]
MADPIRRLVQELARLPGIGEKTATRLAFHLIRSNHQQIRDLAQALLDATEKIRLCSVCMNMTEADPCAMCTDPRREADTICVVATPSDLIAIDRGGHFRGRYHVLHGLLSPLEGIGPDDIRLAELVRRLGGSAEAGGVREVIIATIPSVDGEATAMYIARTLKPLGVKVSRIATGLPVGGELEYSDQATIARALAGRATM